MQRHEAGYREGKLQIDGAYEKVTLLRPMQRHESRYREGRLQIYGAYQKVTLLQHHALPQVGLP